MATAVKAVLSGNSFIDGILYGTKWSGSLTYSFPNTVAPYSGYTHSATGFVQVTLQQQLATQAIFNGKLADGSKAPFSYGSFAQVSGLKIKLASDPNGESDLMIAETDTFDGSNLNTARVADFPELDQRKSSGDVWFGNDGFQYRAPVLGNYSWLTHIHEFGHAVGLAHGHNEGTDTPGFGAVLPYVRNSMEFSVMTYRGYVGDPLNGGYSNETFGYAQTLMMSDIAALQHLYGANFSTNAKNTVYTWNADTGEMSVNGVGQGAPGGNRVFLTIWDGGGVDTYDFSNYTENAFIDLKPGGWSLASQIQRANLGEGAWANGNVYNAYLYKKDLRSLIENAKGGSGNDEIGGNQAKNVIYGNGGNDVLIGRGGADKLSGGAGNDTLWGDFRAPSSTYKGKGLLTESTGANNHTRETALDVTNAIGMRKDSTVQQSDVNPSVKISATGNGNYDWFAFDVKAPGQCLIDIDGGSINISLELFSADGTMLAYNAYSEVEKGDDIYQSFIAYTATTPGTYYVKVSNYGWNPLTNGTAYKLNITVPNPVEKGDGTAGKDSLYGGAGNDKLYGGAGNDLLEGGTGADRLHGGSGTDTASYEKALAGVTASLVKPSINKGEAKGDSYISIENLTGSSHADKLYGNAGANKILGGKGGDLIAGGAGKDVLSGGAGKDTFLFNTKPGKSNVDKITDFNVRDDTIQLENSIFKALGKEGKLSSSMFESNTTGKAGDHNDHVIYNRKTGDLFYDADGNGKGGSLLIAELSKNLSLTHNDFFIV